MVNSVENGKQIDKRIKKKDKGIKKDKKEKFLTSKTLSS